MERITTIGTLERLLEDWGWFELANCLALSPPPDNTSAPERVELVLRIQVPGSIHDDLCVYRVARLTATGIHEWSFDDEDFYHTTDHSVEIAELIQTSAGFGFGLDVPTFVRLVADVFEYERLPDVTEPKPPWSSGSWLAVSAPQKEQPSPGQWVEALVQNGVDAAWRLLGGPAHPTERVPADYTGWFLERPSRLAEHDGGIFMFSVGAEPNGFRLIMERKGADDEMWVAACRSLAGWFPDCEFDPGNVRFTAAQWLALLAAESNEQQGGRRDDLD